MDHHDLTGGRLYHARANSVTSRAPLTKHGLPREPVAPTCHHCGTCMSSTSSELPQLARTSTLPGRRPSQSSRGPSRTGDADNRSMRSFRLSPRSFDSSPLSPFSSSFSDRSVSSSRSRGKSIPSSPNDGRTVKVHPTSRTTRGSGADSPPALTPDTIPSPSSIISQHSDCETLCRHDSATGYISKAAALSSHLTAPVPPPSIAARRASRRSRTTSISSISSLHSITDTIISESPQVATFQTKPDILVLPLHERRGRGASRLSITAGPRSSARSLSPPRRARVQVAHLASTPTRDEFSPRLQPEQGAADAATAPNGSIMSRLGNRLDRLLHRKASAEEKDAPVVTKKVVKKGERDIVFVEEKMESVHWTEI